MLGNRKIKLSESFFSIQGEGVTNGVPSYFIRLYDCNLCCGGLKGELVKAGKATWVCDSISSWTKFEPITFDDFIEKIKKEGEELDILLLDWLIDGRVHFIWTGGEPMMAHSISTIEDFFEYWNAKYPDNKSFHEVETNGTICAADVGATENLYGLFDQVNSSPKLANSGMKRAVRIVPQAILQIKEHPNHWWKFVINCENEKMAFQDWKEIESDFINPYKLDYRKIILMPGVDKREDLPEVTRVLFEASKRLGVRAVTRGHILAWDMTTGV